MSRLRKRRAAPRKRIPVRANSDDVDYWMVGCWSAYGGETKGADSA